MSPSGGCGGLYKCLKVSALIGCRRLPLGRIAREIAELARIPSRKYPEAIEPRSNAHLS